MKNLLLALLLVAAVSFACLFSRQLGKTHQAQAANARLTQNLADLQAQVEEQQKQTTSMHEHLQHTRDTAIAKADEVAQLQQVITNQVAAKTNGANPFAEMFKSKEMKDLVKNQQKTMFGPLIEKSYGTYITGLQMTPEQSGTLKDLIMKKQMVDANMGMSLLGGDVDATKRAELVQQAKTDKEAVDAQIKEFLGPDNFTQFQAYEKTVPDRMTLSSLKDQLGSGATSLTPEQEEQMVQAMSDERQKFKFTTDFTDQSKISGDFGSMFTEEKISQFRKEKEQLDQQYVSRAQSILSSEQLGTFEKFLGSQRELQAVGMKMASKMFGGKGNGN